MNIFGCANKNSTESSLDKLVFSDSFSIENDKLSLLSEAMDNFFDEGVSFSFIATDIETGESFSYNADWQFCSQSTIKAPYVASVISQNPEAFTKYKNLIKKIITVSDNDAYETFRSIYGNSYFETWCEKAGTKETTSQPLYPRDITVQELTSLWQLLYEYLSSGDAPEDFVEWFYGTKYSAIYNTLGSDLKTWTKAGWENGIGSGDDITDEVPDPCYTDGDPSNDETSTNDSGVVFGKERTYIVVIFTNIPTNPPKLEGLVKGIAAAMGD